MAKKIFTILTELMDIAKLKLLQRINNDINKMPILLSIKDENQRIEGLQYFNTDRYKIEFINTLENEKQKAEAVQYINNEDEITSIITNFEDDNKIYALRWIKDRQKETEVIKTIQDNDKKIGIVKELRNDKDKEEIIKTIKDDDKKIEALDEFMFDENKIPIALTIKSDEKKLKVLEKVGLEEGKLEIIASIESDDIKIQAIEQLIGNKDKAEVIASLRDDDKKIRALEKINFNEDKIKIISTIKDKNKAVEAIGKSLGDFDKIDMLKTIKDDEIKAKIAMTIQNPMIKVEAISNISDEQNRLKVIKGIINESQRAEALKYLTNDTEKLKIAINIKDGRAKDLAFLMISDPKVIEQYINTLESDDSKLKYLNYLYPESSRIGIILGLKDDEKKLSAILQIGNYEAKVKAIIETKNKGFIENSILPHIEELNLNSTEVAKIISSTKDKEFIGKCIDSRIGNLTDRNISDLIYLTNDANFMMQYIGKVNLGFSDIDRVVLATGSTELVETCIKERDKLGLDSRDIALLISATKNEDYILKYIREGDKIGLSKTDIEKGLIPHTNSIGENSVLNKAIQGRTNLGLNFNDIIASIYSSTNITTRNRFLKKCIKNKDELNLTPEMITKIIRVMPQKDIENFIKECLYEKNALSLDSKMINCLVASSDDKSFVKDFVKDREKLGLNAKTIVSLISSTNDVQYIRECIRNNQMIGLGQEEKNDLIIRLGCENSKYAYDLLTDITLDLDEETRKHLIKLYETEKNVENLKSKESKKVDLPKEMTIGIEIESIGKESTFLSGQGQTILGSWNCKKDDSIIPNMMFEGEYGLEVVSPILTGNDEQTTNEIYKVGTIMQEFGQYANSTCGGHIHIGADYLTTIDSWKNMIDLWGNTEPILYIIANNKGEAIRYEASRFAVPVSGMIEKAIEKGKLNKEETDLQKFKEALCRMQHLGIHERFQGINFLNLEQKGKGTIEFRVPNGTINPEVWIDNVNLFGGLVKASQELSMIQSKNPEIRTAKENEKLAAFEGIKRDDIDEKTKLEYLLMLAIPEQNRDTYRERYDVNKEELKYDGKTKNRIEQNFANKSIRLSRNAIGKEIFTGEDRVTGEEMQIVEQFIGERMRDNMELVSEQRTEI